MKVKTSAKNDDHISRTFWIFELTHIVFELGHLNPINILNALIILKLVEGCWKIFKSAHNFYQDFTK